MTTGPRGKEIYVSAKTKKRLFWIREVVQSKIPEREPNTMLPPAYMVTVDEIADTGLNEWMEQKYPNIKTLEKRLDALEGQLITELLSPTEEKKT